MEGNRTGFTILDHPADLGLEAHGKTLAESFEQAALGLMSVIVDLTTVEPTQSREVHLKSADVEQLLVKWLAEILYLYDGQRFVASKFTITRIAADELEAVVHGETLSAAKHRTKLDVKAITYHQLLVREDEKGATVRVFLDI